MSRARPTNAGGASARFGIVVPVLNEACMLGASAQRFKRLAQAGCRLVLADGGSNDGTVALAGGLFHEVLRCRAGRARQMNAGARCARAEWLIFAHVDTLLDAAHVHALAAALDRDAATRWGRFDVRLSGKDARLRVIERAMNLRSRLTGVATGDQAIFVRADEFVAVGGFACQPLMEDIAISTLLKRRSQPLCIREPVTTSSRRWERDGLVATVLLMWTLRAAYALGVRSEALVRLYYPERRTAHGCGDLAQPNDGRS